MSSPGGRLRVVYRLLPDFDLIYSLINYHYIDDSWRVGKTGNSPEASLFSVIC